MPISRLPTKAPRRLPMPPMTMTMNAGIRISVSMPGIEAEHRPRRDAAERRQRHAEAENAGEQRRDVAAEAGRHGGVVDAGTHHGADAAALEEQP